MNLRQAVEDACERVRPYVRETPVDEAPELGKGAGPRVFFKMENQQSTGSFKLRGAMNKLLSLTPEQKAAGIVTASSGNHGAAVAYGLRVLGIPGVIYVPENASPAKVANIK